MVVSIPALFSRRAFIIGIIAVLCTVIFGIDLIIPLGAAGGVAYILPLMVTMRLPGSSGVLWTAVAATILTILGLYFSPGDDLYSEALSNRVLALLTFWITAWFIMHSKNLRSEMEREIAERTSLLSEKEKRSRMVMESIPAIISYVDIEQYYQYNNAAHDKNFNPQGRSVIGKRMVNVMDRAAYESIRPYIETALSGRQVSFEYAHVQAGGEVRNYNVKYTPDFDSNGEVLGLHILSNDITEEKLNAEKLRESEQRFRSAFEYALIGKALIDSNRDILHVNQAFCNMLGYSKSGLMGSNINSLTHPDDVALSQEYHDRLYAGEVDGYQLEKRYLHKKGHVVWAMLSVSMVQDIDNNPLYVISQMQDITEARRLTEQLSYQASHDELTGMINRHEFEQRLERVLTTTKKDDSLHALCFLDLDQFKVVNDTSGHVAGDELLRQLGALLGRTVRQRDTIARIGGDEFGILIEHCSLQKAREIAGNLLAALEGFTFIWEDKSYSVGASIGIAAISPGNQDTTEVMKQADTACYAAKDAGRNRIHVYDLMLTHQQREIHWVPEINAALAQDRFQLFAQPIVPIMSADAGKVQYEILLRLKDLDGNLILPKKFLPSAERYNLSVKIDKWVIDHVFQWLIDNPTYADQFDYLAINISGASLGDRSLLRHIVQHFENNREILSKVCFEITETAAISNMWDAQVFISILKDFDCQIVLDDFGSGLSSFAYLKRLPIDVLKIDGMFVRDIAKDKTDYAMVRMINDLGHAMGLRTVAEYVENDLILEKLREIGIDFAQGYHIGEPRPLDEIFGQPGVQNNTGHFQAAGVHTAGVDQET